MIIATNPVLMQLRAATQSWHHRVDHHPLLSPLVRPGIDLAIYGRAIAGLHGPICALEQRSLSGIALLRANYVLTSRQDNLEADLAELGLRPPSATGECPQCREMADLIGLLYVVEGSRLGGQIIASTLLQTLPAKTSCRFFNIAGAEEVWANFGAFAIAACPEHQIKRSCDNAVAAFAFILDHLDQLAASS